MISTLNEQQIDELLKKQVVGRLGCHANGKTYVIPISYAYDGTYIYCHTYEGLKTEIFSVNPAVCFEVDETTDLANWQSVLVWGDVEILEAGENRNTALQTLLNRLVPFNSSLTMQLGAEWPFSADAIEDIKGIVFRINIRERSGRFEISSSSPNLAG